MKNLFRMPKEFKFEQMITLQEIAYTYYIDDGKPKEYPLRGPANENLGLIGDFRQRKFKQSDRSDDEEQFTSVNSILITDVRPKEDRDGIHMIIHDPFELPSAKSENFFTAGNRKVSYLVAPKITSIDESLGNYEPKE